MAFLLQRLRVVTALAWCLIICSCLVARAQQSPNAYTFKHLSIQEGLASNHVSAIIQDRKGFIWIASTALQRYDGTNFITIADYNRVPGNIYYEDICLMEDRKGRIWAGTPDNIRMYDPVTARETLMRVHDSIEIPQQSISCYNMLEDHEGQIWVTTRAGLLWYDDAKRLFRRPPGIPDSISKQMTSAVGEDRHGNLWLSGKQSLYIFSKDRKTLYSQTFNPDRLAALNIPASAKKIFPDHRGHLWIAGRNSVLYRYDAANNQLKEYTFPHPDKTASVRAYDIALDMNRHIWVATEHSGIFRYDSISDSFNEHISGNNKDELGLHYDYEVNCFLNDRDGHLWIGTDVGVNILSLHSQSFTRLDHRSNVSASGTRLPRSEVTDIYQSPQGDVFLGYWGEGLAWMDSQFRLKKLFRYNEKDPANSLPEEHSLVWSITALKNGNIAIGQENGLLSVLDTRQQKLTHHHPEVFADQTVLAMLPENDSTLWVGLYKRGLAKWNPLTGKAALCEDVLQHIHRSTSVMDIVAQGDSLLWLATSTGGILVYNKEKQRVTERVLFWQHGLDTIRNISCLYLLNDSTILAGTDHGLFIYNARNGKYQPLKVNDSFFDEWVLSLKGTPNNGIWLTTQYGFYQYDPRHQALVSFVQNDDIIDNNRKVRRRIALMNDGRLLTGASDHVLAFDPLRLVTSPPPPDVTITGFRVLDHAMIIDSLISNDQPVTLTYRQNFISIEFKSLQYHQERLRYFFKMDGVDERWVNAQGLLTARYTNLAPGNYTFRVQSVNTAGIVSENMTTLSIVVKPAFWQTWWFRLLLILFGLSLVYGYFQARLYLVKRDEKRRAAFQQQIDQLEMKALRAQMNPHFIFNSLNSIQTFMLKNETEQALSYLSRFARLIRNVLDHSQLNNITIAKELEMLENYLELERLRLAAQFDYQIVIDPDLDIDYTEIPSMIIQPFLENAIWHGLLHKTGKGLVILSFQIVNDRILCTVEDNGVGRDAATAIKQAASQKHISKGLQITRDRLSLYNSRFGMNASFDIEDLKDAEGNPIGTRVNLWFPLIED
ncbi:histidine kinase [Chitinophaga horti]|uniref:Histidine kinase n=1 Tax=Chitinophaga horti TaxID=2920382 RepID=A0ABY6J1E2_9BACT|nr:two-component regulator propeller domain-containing protein [Chitinophaga horti]UYQ93373.1 histidine kinase [Chitinophaga horti]